MVFNRKLFFIILVGICGPIFGQIQTFNVEKTHSFSKLIDDISCLNAPINSIIKTSIGGEYKVEKFPLSINQSFSSCVSIHISGTNNYANLQVRDQGFYVEDFGAIANDNVPDDSLIQNCIDAAIALNVTSRVNLGPGLFMLEKGVVIAKKEIGLNGSWTGEYDFVNLTLSGSIPVYGFDMGSITALIITGPTLGIAVQLGRQIVIENILFKGKARSLYESMSKKDIIEWKEEDWEGPNSEVASINRYSPSCAIAIDPFHKTVPLSDQYKSHLSSYRNRKTSGTSLMTIKHCSFIGHYIAIANNSSGSVQNGDNIKVEDSYVRRCHTFWAAGQTQSRSNSIDNIYSLFVNTFVNGSSIGKRNSYSTLPIITNCNIAGFTKQLIWNKKGGFSPIRISNSYMENVFSLGIANATNVSFNQCQIKFGVQGIKVNNRKKRNDFFMPPYQLKTNGVASFIDCTLEYFGNCTVKQPFLLYSKKLSIKGSHIEGGVVLSGGYTNQAKQKLHDVNFENTMIKCSNNSNARNSNKVVGKRNTGSLTLKTQNREILMGGEEIQMWMNGGSSIFKNEGTTYNVFSVGNHEIEVNVGTRKGKITISKINERSDVGLFQIGDNLIHGGAINNASEYGFSSGFRGVVGYVSDIIENKDNYIVIITGIPYGMPSGKLPLYVVDYPRFYLPFWGDFKEGSNIITNVVGQGFPKVGSRFFNRAIKSGTYIKSIDFRNRTITLSSASIKTESYLYMYNAFCSQKIERATSVSNSLTSDKNIVYIDGARIYLDPSIPSFANSETAGYIVVRGGYPSISDNLPILKAITW